MDATEYANLDAVDRQHWFYRGKRAIVRHWMMTNGELRPDDVLVDGGTGAGTWAAEAASFCRAIGIDDHEESLAIAGATLAASGGIAIKASLDRVPLASGSAAVVTLLDVLEHVDDDEAALREMVRLLRPGGVLIVTVPALRWLWSDWDVALHHRRRYHRADLLALMGRTNLEVVHCAYINSLALAPVALIRSWRRWFPAAGGGRRAEDRIPPRLLNELLYHLFVRPACWRWFHPPAGVSLLAVARGV